MDWKNLTSPDQLDEIDVLSRSQGVLIYKHSTRCHICTMALGRIERSWGEDDYTKMRPYFLDVLKNRETSEAVARRYGVEHQSPQVLVISNGACVHHQSHSSISYSEVMSFAG